MEHAPESQSATVSDAASLVRFALSRARLSPDELVSLHQTAEADARVYLMEEMAVHHPTDIIKAAAALYGPAFLYQIRGENAPFAEVIKDKHFSYIIEKFGFPDISIEESLGNIQYKPYTEHWNAAKSYENGMEPVEIRVPDQKGLEALVVFAKSIDTLAPQFNETLADTIRKRLDSYFHYRFGGLARQKALAAEWKEPNHEPQQASIFDENHDDSIDIKAVNQSMEYWASLHNMDTYQEILLRLASVPQIGTNWDLGVLYRKIVSQVNEAVSFFKLMGPANEGFAELVRNIDTISGEDKRRAKAAMDKLDEARDALLTTLGTASDEIGGNKRLTHEQKEARTVYPQRVVDTLKAITKIYSDAGIPAPTLNGRETTVTLASMRAINILRRNPSSPVLDRLAEALGPYSADVQQGFITDLDLHGISPKRQILLLQRFDMTQLTQ